MAWFMGIFLVVSASFFAFCVVRSLRKEEFDTAGNITQRDVDSIEDAVKVANFNKFWGPPNRRIIPSLSSLFHHFNNPHRIARIELVTNDVVVVLFVQTEEMRGEVGYQFERCASGWKVESSLFR
jgi:hypothetical protein